MGEGVVRKTWKEYIVGIEDWVAVIICGFDAARRGNVRVKKLKNGKAVAMMRLQKSW